ncbi:MAG TPA: DUF3300 domain-containing protein [Candidatus Binataceae bacterium]|nr:DUF3300 domain-containing protein [Candidatus Binataceae bacterium]
MTALKRRRFWLLFVCNLVAVFCMSVSSLSVTWAQTVDPTMDPEVPAPLSPDQLDQLVAPIALYPDRLVALVLAAATYPSQVTDANSWLLSNSGLAGADLVGAVNTQPWDPSIKALTQFPSVMAKLANNVTWTSSLGEAYYYQPQDVLAAVQAMRQRARAAGTLVDTPQQRVVLENGTVIIQPVNPDVVYVPTYNPWAVYGAPLAPYPGYTGADLLLAGVLAFGAGILIGILANEAWGWGYWDTDWHHHCVIYQNNVWISRTTNFYAPNRGYWTRPIYGGRGPRERYPYERGGGRERAQRPPEVARGGAAGIWTRPPEGARPEVAGAPRPGAPPQPGIRPEAHGPGAAPRPGERAFPSGARNVPRPEVSTARDYRGFGTAPSPGLNRQAFHGYGAGGEARAATVRGRSSMGGSAGGRAPAPAAHGGGGGGKAPSGHKH